MSGPDPWSRAAPANAPRREPRRALPGTTPGQGTLSEPDVRISSGSVRVVKVQCVSSEEIDLITIVKMSGRFTWRDVVRCLREPLDGAADKPLVLCDMRDLDFEIPSGEVITAARAYAEQGSPPSWKLALLVDDRLGFGMLRMFVAFLGPAAEHASVFSNETDAIRWLEQ